MSFSDRNNVSNLFPTAENSTANLNLKSAKNTVVTPQKRHLRHTVTRPWLCSAKSRNKISIRQKRTPNKAVDHENNVIGKSYMSEQAKRVVIRSMEPNNASIDEVAGTTRDLSKIKERAKSAKSGRFHKLSVEMASDSHGDILSMCEKPTLVTRPRASRREMEYDVLQLCKENETNCGNVVSSKESDRIHVSPEFSAMGISLESTADSLISRLSTEKDEIALMPLVSPSNSAPNCTPTSRDADLVQEQERDLVTPKSGKVSRRRSTGNRSTPTSGTSLTTKRSPGGLGSSPGMMKRNAKGETTLHVACIKVEYEDHFIVTFNMTMLQICYIILSHYFC